MINIIWSASTAKVSKISFAVADKFNYKAKFNLSVLIKYTSLKGLTFRKWHFFTYIIGT